MEVNFMQTQVKAWGNSQGIRLPKDILQEANVEINDMLEVKVSDETMIGYRNASYGAMVLCDNLEGQSVYRKCCGFLIEAMERKLRNRGSLC